ncbi:MAG: phosphotransferase, partial [Actinomycetota bacterium]|nr:phosphotransferase [Actinomycetota bacterium]
PSAELLGQRTGELHVALASAPDDAAFGPEPFTTLYQRSLYQSMRTLTRKTFQLLRRRLEVIEPDSRGDAERLAEREQDLLDRFQALTQGKLDAVRIRTHGDYHLGQVLHTGRDFVIIDFEGEPARPLGERRLKRSPLRDVAGMVRSFHYAAYAGLFEQIARGVAGPSEQVEALEDWTRYWYVWVSAAFLRSYLTTVGEAPFVPPDHEQLSTLLEAYVLEKAVYELGYELNNRPSWVRIPLQGALQLLES